MNLWQHWQKLARSVRPHVIEVAARDRRIVARAQDRAAHLRRLTQAALLHHVQSLKEQVLAKTASGSDELEVEAAAAIQVAAQRTLGHELYEVQLLAGLAMARGSIAEMQTGEGKTFAAAVPALIQVLMGRRVHVATPNSYLAQRDSELLRPLFQTLGVSVGSLAEGVTLEAKRECYRSDVVYGTGYEFGFDYLREQLQWLNLRSNRLGQRFRNRLQGGLNDEPLILLDRNKAFAVVDEIDSVLIDEACLPLVLADGGGPDSADAAAYAAAHEMAKTLAPGQDFVLDPTERSARLTQHGMRRIHCGNGAMGGRKLLRPWSVYVANALRAQWLLRADVDYVIQDRCVRLVDQSTGRVFSERSWSEGLHQAVEVKEGMPGTAEHHTAASITRQRYFRLYGAICGMTGTAGASAREFWQLYRLPTIQIPPRKPLRRDALPTRYFRDADAKLQAIVDEVSLIHRLGRPVLIGSRTIENSQLLAERLARLGIPFRLLNGKQNEAEATIIADSGQAKAITIATNMAGRGTDIQLGPGVEQLGGMHLIGVERNESRRIDDQLSGRVGRQGDRGSFRFYVAATDELISHRAPTLIQQMQTIEQQGTANQAWDAAVEALQIHIEARRFAERRTLLSYDRWLDEIRGKLADS